MLSFVMLIMWQRVQVPPTNMKCLPSRKNVCLCSPLILRIKLGMDLKVWAQFKAHNYLGLSINYLGLDLAHNMMLFWLDKAQFDLQLKNAQNTVTSLFMASKWKFLKT